MAETMNIPAIGKVKTTYVWVGGALVAGIVGYAYWKKSQEAPTDFVGASPDDFGATDYDSPLGSSGGNSTGQFTSVDPDAIDTNGEWTQAAIEKLTSYGWESTAVATALGRYLSRQGLTEEQVTIVQAALAAFGPPPVGGPYPITNALPPPPSGNNPPPTNTPVHVIAYEGNNVDTWLANVRAMHGSTESQIAALNPGLWIQPTQWSNGIGNSPLITYKNVRGFSNPNNPYTPGAPGWTRAFGSQQSIRVK